MRQGVKPIHQRVLWWLSMHGHGLLMVNRQDREVRLGYIGYVMRAGEEVFEPTACAYVPEHMHDFIYAQRFWVTWNNESRVIGDYVVTPRGQAVMGDRPDGLPLRLRGPALIAECRKAEAAQCPVP